MFFIRSGSTFPRICTILCQGAGASTLPWRTHLAKEDVLSTGLSFQTSHFTQQGCNNPSVDVINFHNFRDVLWSCHIEGRLDVHAGQVQCGSQHAAVPDHWSSVLLPRPVLLQQLCHHHLKVLNTDAIKPRTCHCFQLSGSLVPEEE